MHGLSVANSIFRNVFLHKKSSVLLKKCKKQNGKKSSVLTKKKRQEELRTANKRLRERQNETAFYIVGAFLFWMWVPIIIFFEINLISVVIALILTAIIILRWKYILKTTKELNIDSSRHGFIKSLLTFLIACTISSCVG